MAHVGLGIRETSHFEKADRLVKQIRALGSQARLPFKLNVSVTQKGMGLALFQKTIKGDTAKILGQGGNPPPASFK